MRLRYRTSSVIALMAALAAPAASQQPTVILPTKEPPAQPRLRTETKVPVSRPSAPVTVKPSPSKASATATSTDALLHQARTWRQRGRADLAYQALRKAVSVEPRNAQALYLLSQYSAQDGDSSTALSWLDRLRSVAGDADLRVKALEKSIPGGQQTARSTSSAAQTDIAAPSGRAAAPGSVLQPASDQAALPPAPAAIVQAVQSPRPPASTAAPRQPARVANADPGGEARAAGFVALNDGRLGDAESLFKRALNARAGDTDAQGGLGIVRLRQQRFGESERLLAQAMKGPSAARWKDAYDSARFFDRFGKARAALEAGRFDETEQLARPLAAGDFKDRIEAQLLLGEMFIVQKRYAEAQAIYHEAYLLAPERPEAIAGLADALSQLGRSEEALKLLEKLPRTAAAREARSRIERSRATDLQRRGDDFGAGAALASSLSADPANPWTRYEYAKFLTARGQVQQANEVASPLFASTANDVETLQAAALYADFIGRPDQAAVLLARIPQGQRNAAVRELADRVDIKNNVTQAQTLYRSGQTVAAVAMLREAAARPGVGFGARSQIAQSLLEMGDTYQAGNLALEAAREPVPVEARPGDAGGFLAVLGAGGQDAAANAILQQMSQRIRTPEDQAAWRQSFAAYGERRADALRIAGDLASAFDILSTAMTVAPRDPGLLSALGRLYAAGNMGREARQAYDLVLAQRPNDVGTLLDAARAASAGQDFDRASRLMERASKLRPDDPEIFYEMGLMARARGRTREALSAFERAEALMGRGADPRLAGLKPMQSGALGANPFARVAGVPGQPAAASAALPFGAGQPMPFGRAMQAGMPEGSQPNPFGQQGAVQPYGGTMLPANRQPGVPMGAVQPAEQAGYPALPANMMSLQPMSPPPAPPAFTQMPAAPTYQAAVPTYQVPAAAPAYQPSPPQQPAYPGSFAQNPGFALPVPQPQRSTARADRAVPDLQAALVEQEPDVDQPLLGGRTTALTDPQVPLSARIRSEMQATRSTSVPLVTAGVTTRLRSGETGTSNLVEVGGNVEASLPIVGIGEIGLTVRPVSLIAGRPSGDTVGRTGTYPLITAPGIINGVPVVLPSQQSRSVGGVGASVFVRSGWLSADVGVSPYGFRYSDIVGGVRLTPKFGRLEVRLAAERRAVDDSVLSWSGDVDPVSGLAWGGVRRLMGTAGLSLSLDNAGGYLDGTLKRYQGRNVPNNDAVEVNGGFYWRPINETDQRLQVGLNVNYQAFDRNLRYFTLGHGGYFSPQQFVAVGLPINYQGAGRDWRIALNLTPGLQTYSEDTAAIFPGFAEQQAQLLAFSLVDNTIPAFYIGTSRSGFGMAGRINGEYRIQRRTVIGSLLSVDTFGAFSEFRFNIFLRHQLGF